MNTLQQGKPVGQITGAPFITLVDIDGGPIGPGSKNIPEIQPEPGPADSWAAWTDLITVKLARRDFDLSEIAPVMMGDAFRSVMERALKCPGAAAGFDAAMDADDAAMGLPEMPDIRALQDWPASLMEALPPISGGAPDDEPEFTPTAEDLADYTAWSAELDARREMEGWYAANPIASFNALRTD